MNHVGMHIITVNKSLIDCYCFRTDGTESPILEETSNSDTSKEQLKYGELVILGWVNILIILTIFIVVTLVLTFFY